MKDSIRALNYFRPDASRIVFAGGLLIFSIAMNALKPWPLALIVDCVLGSKPLPHWLGSIAAWDKATLLAVLSATILILHFGQGALSAAQNYLSIKISLRGLTRVRNEVFAWLLRLSPRFHQGARAGDLIYRASWDTYAFQTLFQQGMMTFCTAVLSLGVMVAIMARLNMTLTLLALGLAPLVVLSIRLFGGKMRVRTALAQQADSRITSLVQQAIAALPLTQSYAREEFEAGRFGAETAGSETKRLSQHGSELVYWFAIAAIFGVGTAAVMWVGAKQVIEGHLTVGQLLVFLAYLTQLYEPLNQLSHVGATVSGAAAGTRRVFEILDTPEVPQGSRAIAKATGNITFQKVTFGYEAKREVLRDVSFSLKSGESAAIIGPSGVGKTTLLHLLPRFFDSIGGEILLDGVDVRQFRLQDLRAQIAMVLQEPIILSASVAENIAYGKPGASTKEIEAAARAANADAFIRKLSHGYETQIGDGAARLSMGERQRINLARAFLKDAPILLLDEPTSALDAESEALISASLRDLSQGRTTLMVAHRLSTIARMQRVLVLEEGRLTECGTHAELRVAGGYYTRLVASGAMGNE